MNAQDLRNSILQLAVQGQLVEQRPEEGTAKELLKQIRAEKEQLIKEKKIKKEQPLPEIAEDEILFEIPESWEWVHLSDIVDFKMGKTPPRGDETYWGKSYKWVSIADMIDGSIIEDTKESVSEKALNEKFKEVVPKGTLLMSFKLTVGKVSILGMDAVHNEAIISIFPFCDKDYVTRNYLFKILPYMSVFGNTKKAIKGFTLNSDSLSKLVIPVPPLAEQKRIVAKIEEILPYIEQYDKAHTKLEIFNKKFPEDMKKSILQLAMQGKLVEQRTEEGTADELYGQIAAEKARLIKEGKIKAEKPLPEIEEDKIPFEIPKSWKWVRLSSIVTAITDGDHQPPPQVDVGIPFLVISNISQGILSFINTRNVPQEYYDSLQDVRKPQNGDVLFSVTGSYGLVIPIKTDKAFCVQRHIAIIKKPFVSVDYLVKCLSAPHFYKQCTEKATGTAQKTVGLEVLRNLILPLPPLAEQKRIVAKIEEILPYCEKLIK